MEEHRKKRPMPATHRSNARRCATLLLLAAAMSLAASCSTWDLFIEVSPDCEVVQPGSSPSRRIELSPSEDSGSEDILIRDSAGTTTTLSIACWNMGQKIVGDLWRAGVTSPGWFAHEYFYDGDTFLRCALLRDDGTVALIDREDGRIEEVRVPVSESRVVDLGSGHRVLINGFPNVGLALQIMGTGGGDESRVHYTFGRELRWLPTDDPPDVAIEQDGRTYCIFLDILAGQPRTFNVQITK